MKDGSHARERMHRQPGARRVGCHSDQVDRMRTDLMARKIPQEEMRGNTITLSNFGMIGGKYAAPIVIPPAGIRSFVHARPTRSGSLFWTTKSAGGALGTSDSRSRARYWLQNYRFPVARACARSGTKITPKE
jgi:hypothetical protein